MDYIFRRVAIIDHDSQGIGHHEPVLDIINHNEPFSIAMNRY